MAFLIQQFEDKPLSHFAYAIVSKGEMILIDPARNPQPYYDFANAQNARIVGVIETHPHADFVSSHEEIRQTTGATIYVSPLVAAEYPHHPFDEGQSITLGNVQLRAFNTPGHSPDSICIVLQSEGQDKAVFTGDTLFIGDCGRPDLRENVGTLTATRETLARDMFYSLRKKLMVLSDDVLVYPAHGAGSLCGKALSNANSSTIGAERATNWSCNPHISESDFIAELIAEQPFMPHYFGYDVSLNRKGASAFAPAVAAVQHRKAVNCEKCSNELEQSVVIIDTRPQEQYKQGHLKNSINLMIGGKFETWLGSIIKPHEPFYLAAQNEEELTTLIQRIAKIGYETQIKEAFILNYETQKSDILDVEDFRQHPEKYTIIDIRNHAEARHKNIFPTAIHIPLSDLRDLYTHIPTDKPILIHCAGGYRSAAGSSIVKQYFPEKAVYDLGEAITSF